MLCQDFCIFQLLINVLSRNIITRHIVDLSESFKKNTKFNQLNLFQVVNCKYYFENEIKLLKAFKISTYSE